MSARHRLRLNLLGATASALAICCSTPMPAAIAASKPPLPPARPVHYDPDPDICQPAALQRSFQLQLLPWADQPAAVQARLRQVQLEMLQATLQRCISKGLLSPDAARNLEQTLGTSGPEAVQPSGSRP
ncbi:MAG: hypothetical protein NTY67_08275 [Cyanobacteria bacterium]|nr:hypothetical protein [Cyanobacteriota bacterium]